MRFSGIDACGEDERGLGQSGCDVPRGFLSPIRGTFGFAPSGSGGETRAYLQGIHPDPLLVEIVHEIPVGVGRAGQNAAVGVLGRFAKRAISLFLATTISPRAGAVAAAADTIAGGDSHDALPVSRRMRWCRCDDWTVRERTVDDSRAACVGSRRQSPPLLSGRYSAFGDERADSFQSADRPKG